MRRHVDKAEDGKEGFAIDTTVASYLLERCQARQQDGFY
jgi:hypothetical protein